MLPRKLSALITFAFAGTLLAHAGQFLEAPQYTTGTNPQAVATAHFTGSGNLDMVVANSTSNTISVLLGNGNGTFAPQVTYPTGSAPEGVAVGDFNGDGYTDIAVTNSGSNSISIFLNNGSGGFTPSAAAIPVGLQPTGIAVADLRGHQGNETLDIVVTNSGNSQLTVVGVLLGNGDGTFQSQVTYSGGKGAGSVAIGDVNGDKIPDLIVADPTPANNAGPSTISVYLGNGDGTFQGQIQYPTGNVPVYVALADVNGDGNPDVITANQGTAGQPNYSVSVLLDNWVNGSFRGFLAPVNYPVAALPTALTVVDLNGDEIPDIAVSAGVGNAITVWWGAGDGTFQQVMNFGTGDIPYSVVAGDFNNDKKIDLAVADWGDNSVSVLINNGNQSFQTRQDYATNTSAYAVAAFDFNGDGVPDLAVASNTCQGSGPCAIGILLGNGDGTFQSPSQYSVATGSVLHSIVEGDFNGDGVPDLAVADYANNKVDILLGARGVNGNAKTYTLSAPNIFPVGNEPASLAVGDFNHDGKLDLAVANFNSNTVSILLGNGDGTLQPATNYAVGSGPVSIATGDFNGDGIPDLAVVNETDDGGTGSVSVLLGSTSTPGTFTLQGTYPTASGGNPLSVAVGDLNGDGNTDLAVADYRTGEISVFLGTGTGSFQAQLPYQVGINPSAVIIQDFNGDGKADLAVTSTPLNPTIGNLVGLLLYTGNNAQGQPKFGPVSLYNIGQKQSYSAAVADFNLDGTPDLAVANNAISNTGSNGGSNSVSILLNTGGTTVNVTASGTAIYGDKIGFDVQVAASVLNGTAPTGNVSVEKGNTVLNSGKLGGGQTTVTVNTLPAGSDTLSIVYSGDPNYQPHTVPYTVVVSPANTTTAVGSSNNPAMPNEPVTLSATVGSSAGLPTGTVTFMDGATQLGNGTIGSNGQATLSTSALAMGTHNIIASYSGTANYATSTSPAFNQIVGQASTNVALVPSATEADQNQNVTFTATVSSVATGNSLSGVVEFFDGTKQLGTSTVSASGVATYATSSLIAGSHTITAIYEGDTDFLESTSPAVNIQITGLGFGLAASPSSVSVAPGASATSTVTITPAGGLSPSTVNLACSITPAVSPAPTCSLNSVSNAGTSTLTLKTTGPQAALLPGEKTPWNGLFALGLAIPAILLGTRGSQKSNRRKLIVFCLIFLAIGGCIFQTACGGGSGNGSQNNGNTGTPANTYKVTVTGTANGASQQTTTVTLTVQ